MKYKKLLQNFGTNVRNYRIEKGFSQEQLAAKAKVHRTYIGGIERGERNVSLVNIARIADALSVRISDIVE